MSTGPGQPPALERLHVPAETADGIAVIAGELAIPTDKQGVYFSDGLLTAIDDRMASVSYAPEIGEALRSVLSSTDSAAAGYVVLDGLYSGSLVAGVNPDNRTAAELAPIDTAHNRAYEFATEHLTRQLRMALAIGTLVGTPYRLFDEKRFIIPVTAYGALDPERFGGMGPNLLHKDAGFLAPPQPADLEPTRRGPAVDVAALLAINPDKTGLGKSWLVREDVEAIMAGLDPWERAALREHIYSYLPAHGLNDAAELAEFPVLYDDENGAPRLRFSGKMLGHMRRHPDALHVHDSERHERVIGLLGKLNGMLMAGVIEFPLQPGEILFANQARTFHGREEVQDPNRLLAQIFLKSRNR